jgi:hypothetical protein
MDPCNGIRVAGENDCARAINMIKPPPTLNTEVSREVRKDKIAKKTINSTDIKSVFLLLKDLRLTYDRYRSNSFPAYFRGKSLAA